MEGKGRRSPSPDITDTVQLKRDQHRKAKDENKEQEQEVDDQGTKGSNNNNKGNRGRGNAKKKGGKNNGKGTSKNKNEDKESIDDVEQIGEDVKSIQISKEEGNEGNLFGKGFEGGAPPQPGGIPGLDFPLNMLSNVEESMKPVSEILAGITDIDFPEPEPEPEAEVFGSGVRRSSRIKSLESQKGRKRREVVFSSSSSLDSSLSKSLTTLNDDDSNSNSNETPGSNSPREDLNSSSGVSSLGLSSTIGSNEAKTDSKPFKVKSRWRYSADTESFNSTDPSIGDDQMPILTREAKVVEDEFVPSKDLVKRAGHILYEKSDLELVEKLKKFQGVEDSIFRTQRSISKESKGMVCDCYLSPDDIERGEKGCEEDCLNRLLMVECGPKCSTGDRCMNKRFQRKEYAKLEVFKTEKKGHGLRTLEAIPEGGFVIEYVGEVLDPDLFERRAKDYAKENQEHFYFMALKSDSIIDATRKGNCSRFINHSCEPNCETQKWTVNGELRIGFFSIRDLKPGDEIVFDYQFQRYGKKAQRCFCGTPSCRGWIGEEEDDDEDLEDDRELASPEDEESAREVAEKKKKRVRKAAERRRKKDKARILEDVALEEELNQLERSGLKNRNHTLTLSRLMVRAEKWDDKERLLNVLINGDSACRRLFLDYRGLKLLYNWMVNLPLPVEDAKDQAIRDEDYHLLCLKALDSLPIPNKTMLLDSKVITLMEVWSAVPEKTLCWEAETPVTQEKAPPPDLAVAEAPPIIKSEPAPEEMVTESEMKPVKPFAPELEKMEVDAPVLGTEVEPPAIPELKYTVWKFKDHSKRLAISWAALKEEFRIPKKERVEIMKAHEREADKGYSALVDSQSSNDRRLKWDSSNIGGYNRNERGGRRLSVLDPNSFHRQFHRFRDKDRYSHLSKEERRKKFEEEMKEQDRLLEEERQRKLQNELIAVHEARCKELGLDSRTTPMVDQQGHYYLDPASVQWILINPEDPSLHPGIQRMLEALQVREWQEPQAQDMEKGEPEFPNFPPWPEMLPPPPPMPPTSLPDGWKMAVDDEGRCYYYHVRTRHTQWTPPTEEDVFAIGYESSDTSSDSSEERDMADNVNGHPVISTSRTKIVEKRERRKQTGLVQEMILSPHEDEDRSGISRAMIRARKLEVLEEKRQQRAAEVSVEEMEESANVVDEDSNELFQKPASPHQSADNAERTETAASDDENHVSSSPIETELDITLASLKEDPLGDIESSNNPIAIPGFGFEPRDHLIASTASSGAPSLPKKHRTSKHQRKQKHTEYKKILSEKSKEDFRNKIATVVVSYLNPYRRPDAKGGRIDTTEDFKHLARKMTHSILLKELKQYREGKPLEVTEGVRQKTKEYVKKYMSRYSSTYKRSPESSQK